MWNCPRCWPAPPRGRPEDAGKSCWPSSASPTRRAPPPPSWPGGAPHRWAGARPRANEPSLLLADEPTGNLDSSNTRDVLRLLRRAHAGGQAILLVTHDARVASLADRVINLFDGMVADDANIVSIPRHATGVADVLELRG